MAILTPTKIRAVLYYIITFLCIIDIGCSLRTIFFIDQWSGNRDRTSVDWINVGAAIVALVQLLWIIVLLACNDNPLSQNVLCRAKAHFISSIVFAWLWLGAGTINSMVCPTACDFIDGPNLDPGRCGPTVTEAVVSFLMCAINVFLSVYIPRVAKRYATGLNNNIALGGTSTESQARVQGSSTSPITLRATKSASLVDDDDASTIVGHETNNASESDVKLKELV